MAGAGIECPTCKRVRAPTLPTCPWCRASAPPADDLGESRSPALLDPDTERGTIASLPSRIVLVLAVLAFGLTFWELGALRGVRPHAYASGGLLVSLLGLALAVVITLALTAGVDWVGRRVRIQGQAPSVFSIVALGLLGLLPAVWLPIDRFVDETNAFGGDPTRIDVPCTWDEARQLRDTTTGELLHVTLHTTCLPPGGGSMTFDMSLEGASVVGDHGQLTVPMWRGLLVGWLYTLDRDAGEDAALLARPPP